MQIDLPLSPDTEQAILAAVQSGDHSRVAEHLAAAFRQSGPEILSSIIIGKANAQIEREQSWEEFETEKTADQIAAEQGIGPITDSKSLVFPDWPEGENVDDFIARAKGCDLEDIAP